MKEKKTFSWWVGYLIGIIGIACIASVICTLVIVGAISAIRFLLSVV